MRILVVTGTYAPASGGAENSLAETLGYLGEIGHEIVIVTRGSNYRAQKDVEPRIVQCRNRRELAFVLGDLVDSVRPDVVFTQLLWSDYVLENKQKYGVRVVYFARNTSSDLDISPGHRKSPELVVANSRDTKRFLDRKWGCDSAVIYPVVRDRRFSPVLCKDRRFHFMTNPVEFKGGGIFLKIAKLRPGLQFGTVCGWHQFRTGDSPEDGWNQEMIQELGLSLNKKNMKMPAFVKFDGVANVRILPVTNRMDRLFRRVRVVLLPSVWREPLSRTVVEAAACGVPPIVSDVGGVLEGPHVPELVVPKGADVDEWLDRIDDLQGEESWQTASKRIRAEYEKYRKENAVQLREFCEKLSDMLK